MIFFQLLHIGVDFYSFPLCHLFPLPSFPSAIFPLSLPFTLLRCFHSPHLLSCILPYPALLTLSALSVLLTLLTLSVLLILSANPLVFNALRYMPAPQSTQAYIVIF